MSDLPNPEQQGNSPKKKRKKRFLVGEVPIFVEMCNFCENNWGSNIKFYDVVSKAHKKQLRGCEFCVFGMTLGLNGRAPPLLGARTQVEAAAFMLAQMEAEKLGLELVVEEEAPPDTSEPPPAETQTGEGNK